MKEAVLFGSKSTASFIEKHRFLLKHARYVKKISHPINRFIRLALRFYILFQFAQWLLMESPGQSSVRKGTQGNASAFCRLQRGLTCQA